MKRSDIDSTAATNWYWVTASTMLILVEALGAVQVALVNRINSQETGLGACMATATGWVLVIGLQRRR